MDMSEEEFGEHEGKIIIKHDSMRYTVPFLIHYTPGLISINQENQKLFFEIDHPQEWSFAKISIINSKDGSKQTVTTTPNKKASIEINENSKYWIDAKIRVKGNTSNAFNTIEINSITENYNRVNPIDIPEKPIMIISIILIGIGIFGMIKRK